MLPFVLGRRSRPDASWPSAAMPTTSRSAAAGRSSRLPERDRDLEVTWVVLAAQGTRGEARASAEDSSRRRLAPRSSSTGSETASCPSRRRPSRRSSRAEERVQPELMLTHTRDDLHQDHRLASRAHMEHVPRPTDPRVRDAQVRWRPRAAEPLRRRSKTRASPQDRACFVSTSRPSAKALVRRGDCSAG